MEIGFVNVKCEIAAVRPLSFAHLDGRLELRWNSASMPLIQMGNNATDKFSPSIRVTCAQFKARWQLGQNSGDKPVLAFLF
jgi:hypothetical protein